MGEREIIGEEVVIRMKYESKIASGEYLTTKATGE